MKYLPVFFLALLLCSISRPSSAQVPPPQYQVGGAFDTVSPSLREALHNNIDVVRLGINADWIAKANLRPDPVIESYLELARAVKMGEVPGAVVLLDSFFGENIPVGIGFRITDPERHHAEWSTYYELGELTGVVVVTPLALSALEAGRITLKQNVGTWLPSLAGTDKSPITVEMLLRHSSGLPARIELSPDIRTREQLMNEIAAMPLANNPGLVVEPSGLNFLLLGLILENESGVPVQELAARELFTPLGMVNTVSDLPDHLRDQCAAGPYSKWHGRMAWAEAAEPSAFILGSSAGNGGLVTNCDDLAVLSRALLLGAAGGLSDFVSSQTMQTSMHPDIDLGRGENQGLGWAINGFGPGSFGWNSPNGCSLWINPDKQIFMVMLANANHPTEADAPKFTKARQAATKLIISGFPVQREQANSRTELPSDSAVPGGKVVCSSLNEEASFTAK